MPKVILNRWDGGIAEDIRTENSGESATSLNFDIFTNPHKLIPYADSIAETLNTGAMTDIKISEVDVSLIGSSYLITGVGNESSSSTKTAFYTKANITSTFNQQAVATAGTVLRNSGFTYKDKFFALRYNGSNQYALDRYDSAGTVTAIGTINQASGDQSYGVYLLAKPFVHPLDNIAYIVIGTTITSWDGTTLTTTTSILPTGYECVSLTDYGTYLAITMRPLRSNGNAITYLWGRDATNNTLQGNIPWGEDNLLMVENLDNNLFAVMQPQTVFGTAFTNKIIIRGYFGGSVEPIKSITLSSSDTTAFPTIKAKNGNTLYFGNQNADDCIYAFRKNKLGNYVLTKDRYLFNGVTTAGGLAGLSIIGDIMWRLIVGIAGTFSLMRSKTFNEATYVSTSVYKTTINPGMELKDRTKHKQLEAVLISYTGKASGTVKLRYSVDGSAMTNIISETTTAIEETKEANTESDGTALLAGREFQFQIESTGGVEVKSIEYRYSVLNTTI